MRKLTAATIMALALTGCPPDTTLPDVINDIDPKAVIALGGEYVEWRARLEMRIEDLSHDGEDYEEYRLAVTMAKIADQTLQRLTTPEAPTGGNGTGLAPVRPMGIER